MLKFCGRGGAGGWSAVEWAPIGLYTKLKKTRTFEMDVMQKILIGKLSNLAHVIFTIGCLYQYYSISTIWATTNKTIPRYYFIQGVF